MGLVGGVGGVGLVGGTGRDGGLGGVGGDGILGLPERDVPRPWELLEGRMVASLKG